MAQAMSDAQSIEDISPDVQISWFKWEFLRRNADFQKDCASFEAQYGDWFKENGFWWSRKGPAYSPHAWFIFCSKIAPCAKDICIRWGVSDPYDPNWIFEANGIRMEAGSSVALPFFFNDAKDADIWDMRAIDPEVFPSEDDRIDAMLKDVPLKIEGSRSETGSDGRMIKVEVDITEPLHVTIAAVERRIEFARRRFEAQIGHPVDHRRKPRLRLDQYKRYLRAWDLRAKGNRTFEQIARDLFAPEMENEGPYHPAVKKARTHFRRACEFIDGGYRHIEG